MTKALPDSPTAAPRPGGRRGGLAVVPGKDSLRVARLQKGLGLTQVELARILETSASTLARRPLSGPELDRLSILEAISRLAARIVPPEHLARWLAEEKIPLDGAAPKELLASESGRRQLETFLLRALDGAAF
jgi:transcriptional regulator with XRE-family HTH domain